MGEAAARRRAENGAILEPKGMAPANLKQQVEVKTGVARDALAVALQVGDILLHMSPEGARETAEALLMAAKTVEALRAQQEHRIVLPTT